MAVGEHGKGGRVFISCWGPERRGEGGIIEQKFGRG